MVPTWWCVWRLVSPTRTNVPAGNIFHIVKDLRIYSTPGNSPSAFLTLRCLRVLRVPWRRFWSTMASFFGVGKHCLWFAWIWCCTQEQAFSTSHIFSKKGNCLGISSSVGSCDICVEHFVAAPKLHDGGYLGGVSTAASILRVYNSSRSWHFVVGYSASGPVH